MARESSEEFRIHGFCSDLKKNLSISVVVDLLLSTASRTWWGSFVAVGWSQPLEHWTPRVGESSRSDSRNCSLSAEKKRKFKGFLVLVGNVAYICRLECARSDCKQRGHQMVPLLPDVAWLVVPPTCVGHIIDMSRIFKKWVRSSCTLLVLGTTSRISWISRLLLAERSGPGRSPKLTRRGSFPGGSESKTAWTIADRGIDRHTDRQTEIQTEKRMKKEKKGWMKEMLDYKEEKERKKIDGGKKAKNDEWRNLSFQTRSSTGREKRRFKSSVRRIAWPFEG